MTGAIAEFLRLDFIRLLKLCLELRQRFLGARRSVVITVDQRLYPLGGMVNNARVTSPSNKASLNQVRTQSFLPSFLAASRVP